MYIAWVCAQLARVERAKLMLVASAAVPIPRIALASKAASVANFLASSSRIRTAMYSAATEHPPDGVRDQHGKLLVMPLAQPQQPLRDRLERGSLERVLAAQVGARVEPDVSDHGGVLDLGAV
jgi:hypothetical protein